jgi:hypothetical protein
VVVWWDRGGTDPVRVPPAGRPLTGRNQVLKFIWWPQTEPDMATAKVDQLSE